MTELDGRFTEELEGKTLLTIEPDKSKYYSEWYPYGDEVEFAFPSTIQDIDEASKCLALSRPTASVFHAMRVLEVGLYALGRYMGIDDIEANWGEAIGKIEKAIKRFDSSAPPRSALVERAEWEERRQFSSEAAGHFHHMKDGVRNRAAHAGYMYSDDKAREIFESVGQFMRHLVTRLTEDGEF